MRSAGSSPEQSPTTRVSDEDEEQHASVERRRQDDRRIDEQAEQRLAAARRPAQGRQRPPATREAQALGQELAYQPAAAGAEREADRHLAGARRRACQQQVAEVRAGDEQHEPGAAEQHPQRVGEVAPRSAAPLPPAARAGADRGSPAARRHRQRPVVARQPLLEGHVGFGCLAASGRDARAQSAEHVQPHDLLDGAGHVVQPRPSGQDCRQIRQRQPGVGPLPHRLAEERRRRHADHLERALAQRDGAADHVGASAEAPLPQLVADHGLRRAAFAPAPSRRRTCGRSAPARPACRSTTSRPGGARSPPARRRRARACDAMQAAARGHRRRQLRAAPLQVEELLVGHERALAALAMPMPTPRAFGVGEQHQRLRLAHRQRRSAGRCSAG